MNKETLSEIMSINPENLQEQQANAMKGYLLDKLATMAELVHNNRISEAREMLVFSPAGDGYGNDNYYLDLDYTGNHDEGFDISDALDIIMYLERKKVLPSEN